MTFIVSPLLGLGSGFLLKEFDEKSDGRTPDVVSGSDPRSTQPDKMGPPSTNNTQDVTTGMLSCILGASLMYHDFNGHSWNVEQSFDKLQATLRKKMTLGAPRLLAKETMPNLQNRILLKDPSDPRRHL